VIRFRRTEFEYLFCHIIFIICLRWGGGGTIRLLTISAQYPGSGGRGGVSIVSPASAPPSVVDIWNCGVWRRMHCYSNISAGYCTENSAPLPPHSKEWIQNLNISQFLWLSFLFFFRYIIKMMFVQNCTYCTKCTHRCIHMYAQYITKWYSDAAGTVHPVRPSLVFHTLMYYCYVRNKLSILSCKKYPRQRSWGLCALSVPMMGL
jgi:hypothetical protein